jgi:hypothetical protein
MNYRPITDTWILARPKVKYYGAYPNGFLERARALLGVGRGDSVLHVCGGRAKDYPSWKRICPHDCTLDFDPALSPDYWARAEQRLPLPFCPVTGDALPWPALLADPPYTESEAKHYAPGPAAFPSAREVVARMLEAVRPGGRVGILHFKIPRPPADVPVRLVAVCSVWMGYDNAIRAYTVFERKA